MRARLLTPPGFGKCDSNRFSALRPFVCCAALAILGRSIAPGGPLNDTVAGSIGAFVLKRHGPLRWRERRHGNLSRFVNLYS